MIYFVQFLTNINHLSKQYTPLLQIHGRFQSLNTIQNNHNFVFVVWRTAYFKVCEFESTPKLLRMNYAVCNLHRNFLIYVLIRELYNPVLFLVGWLSLARQTGVKPDIMFWNEMILCATSKHGYKDMRSVGLFLYHFENGRMRSDYERGREGISKNSFFGGLNSTEFLYLWYIFKELMVSWRIDVNFIPYIQHRPSDVNMFMHVRGH